MESGDNVCRQLDAISLGVEAQIDPLMVHSRRILQKTRSIAQEIGFNDSAIKNWEDNKHKQIENGMKLIKRIALAE